MQLSKFVITGLAASTAVSASPIASQEIDKRDLNAVLTDVTGLLKTVIDDVGDILADAGLNLTSVLDPILAPLDLKKREQELEMQKRSEDVALQERLDLGAIIADVNHLLSDVLAGVGKLSADLLGL